MKKLAAISTILYSIILFLLILSCSEDQKPKSEPVVIYPTKSLYIDLNQAVQPSIICVVNSESGLKSIETFIVKKDADGNEVEEQLGRPVTTFYNPHSYSINETPLYTADMIYFRLVAKDAAGNVIMSQLPLEVQGLYGLPEVYLSSDEAGTGNIESIRFIEDDPMPPLYAQLSSEENIKYVVVSETVKGITSIVNDTIFFDNEVQQTTLNLTHWENGETYEFTKGATALRVKVAAGSMEKSREIVIPINFIQAITLVWTQTDNLYNGLPTNEDFEISGSITSANPLSSFTYTLISRDGTQLQAPAQITVNEDDTYSVMVNADPELATIILDAKDMAGKTASLTRNAHVGYKYHYLLAGGPASGLSGDPDALPFFSAELGRVMSYCDAQDNYSKVDFGFSIWSSYKQIRINNLTQSDKFMNSSCGTYDSSGALLWPAINVYEIKESTIAWADFEQASITDLQSDPGISVTQKGINLFVNLTTTPIPDKVATYEPLINGEKKKVIIAIDKIEGGSRVTTTFWMKCKVEL